MSSSPWALRDTSREVEAQTQPWELSDLGGWRGSSFLPLLHLSHLGLQPHPSQTLSLALGSLSENPIRASAGQGAQGQRHLGQKPFAVSPGPGTACLPASSPAASPSSSTMGQVGRQLAIIGDDINRRYDSEFQAMLQHLQPTAENAYEYFTKIASR